MVEGSDCEMTIATDKAGKKDDGDHDDDGDEGREEEGKQEEEKEEEADEDHREKHNDRRVTGWQTNAKENTRPVN